MAKKLGTTWKSSLPLLLLMVVCWTARGQVTSGPNGNGSGTASVGAGTNVIVTTNGSAVTISVGTNVVVRTAGVTNLVVTNGNFVVTNTTTHTSISVSGTNITQVGLTGSTNFTSGGGGLGYTLFFSGPNSINPANATTYYMGTFPGASLWTTATDTQMAVPKSGTLKGLFINVRINGTTGTTENVNCYVTNFTAVTGTGNSTMTWTAGSRQISVTGLSLAVTAGDNIVVVFKTPTWATQPTSVYATVYAYIE